MAVSSASAAVASSSTLQLITPPMFQFLKDRVVMVAPEWIQQHLSGCVSLIVHPSGFKMSVARKPPQIELFSDYGTKKEQESIKGAVQKTLQLMPLDWKDTKMDYQTVIPYKNPKCPNYVHVVRCGWPALRQFRSAVCKELSFEYPANGRYLDETTKEFRDVIAIGYSEPTTESK